MWSWIARLEDGRLVGIDADRVAVDVFRRVQLAETGLPRDIIADAHALPVLSEGRLLALGRIVEGADIGDRDFDLLVDVARPLDVADEEVVDYRDIHAAQESDELVLVREGHVGFGDEGRLPFGLIIAHLDGLGRNRVAKLFVYQRHAVRGGIEEGLVAERAIEQKRYFERGFSAPRRKKPWPIPER